MYDNSDISENVLNLLDMAGAVNEVQFDDDEVEGKVHEIDADSEEDMIVYACYIAECIVLKKDIDISQKGIKFLRNKILDSIINLSYI